MKTISAILGLMIISSTAMAGVLDDSTYCRTVKIGGAYGQPKEKRKHCISFKDDKATDNANTFFGNSSETFNYDLEDGQVINTDTNKKAGYEIHDGGDTLTMESGAVLLIEI